MTLASRGGQELSKSMWQPVYDIYGANECPEYDSGPKIQKFELEAVPLWHFVKVGFCYFHAIKKLKKKLLRKKQVWKKQLRKKITSEKITLDNIYSDQQTK